MVARRKINTFLLVKPRSLLEQNVACSFLQCFLISGTDCYWLQYEADKLHCIILSYDSSFNKMAALRQNERVWNSGKQKLHSFQATSYYVQQKSKQVIFLGIWKEPAWKGSLRGTWEITWPSVLYDAEDRIACKYRVTPDNFQLGF